MPVLDSLKRWLSGQRKDPKQGFWEQWDQRILELENRLRISHEDKLLVGDLAKVEAVCEELLHHLGEAGQESGAEPRAERLRRRVELFRTVARLLTRDADGRALLWGDFLKRLPEIRDTLHYKTRVKYERLRLDYESNRFR